MSFKPTFSLYCGDDLPTSRICNSCGWVYLGLGGKHRLKRCENGACPSNAEGRPDNESDTDTDTPTEGELLDVIGLLSGHIAHLCAFEEVLALEPGMKLSLEQAQDVMRRAGLYDDPQ